jgi:hypothetical protein
MCLCGVDYFSTLGYQPSIAFEGPGTLTPLATLVLIGFAAVGLHEQRRRRSEGLPVPREPAYAAKRSQDGEAPAASERANGRMLFANVRRRGTGSPSRRTAHDPHRLRDWAS